ncbi:hypothetical protein SBRCBS47491_004557 [Sporothrix bragantina]|uniref:Carboxymuconolactone decarboxylase-like domain-containing protein n=1 Tax=Sporothrix bragantina TaxID=671064 RepID=A0ABP0BPF7_9PEZI
MDGGKSNDVNVAHTKAEKKLALKRIRDRRSQQAMRDRQKREILSLREQVAQLSQIVRDAGLAGGFSHDKDSQVDDSQSEDQQPDDSRLSPRHALASPHTQASTLLDTMEKRATDYIAELASRPGNDKVDAIWYSVAACAFAGSNAGYLVPHVYLAAIAPFSDNAEARRTILRRIKESLINGAFVYGDPRLLNAFYPLSEAIPDEESIDQVIVRDNVTNPYDLTARGEAYMERVFGADDMKRFTTVMDKFWPDLRKLIVNYCYGMYQSERSVLADVDTSRISLASLVTMDVPKQLSWHMRGFMNLGGTREELVNTLTIATTIVDLVGVKLQNTLPDIDETINCAKLV